LEERRAGDIRSRGTITPLHGADFEKSFGQWKRAAQLQAFDDDDGWGFWASAFYAGQIQLSA